MLEAKRHELEAAAGAKLAAAQALAEKLEGLNVKVTQKSGMDGRLFGSVTNVDVVDALKAQGIAVEKAMIRMPEGPLKHTGEFPLTVAPHSDVVASITMTVIGDTTQG
jgi:large subunit ribosomal protein L9